MNIFLSADIEGTCGIAAWEETEREPACLPFRAQMSREVAALRQATGAASARDLEPMLEAFGQSAPAGTAPTAIEFAAGELRAKGVQVAASQLAEANQRLRPLGYQLQSDADALVLRERAAP